MSEFIDVEWFDTGATGLPNQTIGVVLIYNEDAGFKCYMGIGDGVSESDDMEHIYQHGQKISHTVAKSIWGSRMRAEWTSRHLADEDLSFYLYDGKKQYRHANIASALYEHKLMQHQAYNVLKSAKAVGEWSEIRAKQLVEKQK